MHKIAQDYFATVAEAVSQGPPAELVTVADRLFDAYLTGRHVYTMGNGASASLAAHMACDMGKGTATDLGRPSTEVAAPRLKITSLPDNVALLTAYGNDIAYECVFTEHLKSLLDDGDVVVAVSGSGGSPNVLRALEYARACGATTIGFTGAQAAAEQLRARCDVVVSAPLEMMEQIEDVHVMFHHVVSLMLRRRIREHVQSLNVQTA